MSSKSLSPAGQVISDILGLVGVIVTPKHVMGWTPVQRVRAERWAAASYLQASDNDGIVVPEMPKFLKPYERPWK